MPLGAACLRCGEENPSSSSPTSPPNRLHCGFRVAKQMKMNFVSQPRSRRTQLRLTEMGRRISAVGLLALVGAGCGREEIQVYTVPKDKPAVSTEAKGRPQLSWTLPKDWKEVGAGQMSVASFSIQGSGGRDVQVTITPLAKLSGRDTEIVNMWREQVGQEPLSREEAAKSIRVNESRSESKITYIT